MIDRACEPRRRRFLSGGRRMMLEEGSDIVIREREKADEGLRGGIALLSKTNLPWKFPGTKSTRST